MTGLSSCISSIGARNVTKRVYRKVILVEMIRYPDKVVVRDDSYEVVFKAGVKVEVEV